MVSSTFATLREAFTDFDSRCFGTGMLGMSGDGDTQRAKDLKRDYGFNLINPLIY
jgi:hypothetical protein